ncbi:MAG: hypothetical protein G3H99_05400 [Ferrovum sp.]|nr:hypothetical protein [Ferrovum sp.]NDU87129.1 hypothetical protein [Ferrovum sp.]
MKNIFRLAAATTLMSCVLVSTPARADRGWGWGWGMMGLATGAMVGAELASPYYPRYYYPYAPPVVYAAPPVVVAQQAPAVYSPQGTARVSPEAPPAQAAPNNSWFYCGSSKKYYPYVRTCAQPWQAVPATPPGGPN